MPSVGIGLFVLGYAAVYTGVQMLKRPAGGTSGSFLYWLTGIDSLGSPSGGHGGSKVGGGAKNSGGQDSITPNPKKGTHGVLLHK